jgi:hypothetical protein
MSMFDLMEKKKAEAMAAALFKARQNSLRVRIPENVVDDRAFNAISIGLKTWDVLTCLLDIAAAVKLAAGASAAAQISVEAIAANEAAAVAVASAGGGTNFAAALTVAEAVSLAGPIVAWAGLWVAMGAPYLQIRQAISEERAKRGVAHGVLIGAFGHRPERARGFLLRQPESSNNNWVPGLTNVAQQSFRMAFIAGYKQGREMSQTQRKVFWKVFTKTLKHENKRLWDNDWRDDRVWDNWFWEAGTAFQKWHVDVPDNLARKIANF